MTIVYTDAHQAHQPEFEIYDGEKVAYAETAARAEKIIGALHTQGGHEIIGPKEFPMDHIYSVHQLAYVKFLEQCSHGLQEGDQLYPSYFMSDTYAPITKGTYEASRQAVNVALTGAERLLGGEKMLYTLCRPPGHHAEHHSMGGYCYFNNAAIAAQYLSEYGTVAILDIDFHHGNGTQNIFYDRDDVLYVSLHADPVTSYPYGSGFAEETGRGRGINHTINYPLDLSTTNEEYLDTLRKAVAQIKKFNPVFLIVSVGFDTFEHDPIGGLELTLPVYQQIGSRIAELQLPSLLIQEGGYNVEHLGEMASGFLDGFERSFTQA